MWSFSEQSNWGVRITPKFNDFFIDTDTTAADNLLREVTQNAGDAALTSEGKVTVSFRFGSMSKSRFKARYMEHLEPHLSACDPRARDVLAETGPVEFLTIEDFGTTGLTGAVDRDTDNSNYNGFWWRYGESRKAGEEGGGMAWARRLSRLVRGFVSFSG